MHVHINMDHGGNMQTHTSAWTQAPCPQPPCPGTLGCPRGQPCPPPPCLGCPQGRPHAPPGPALTGARASSRQGWSRSPAPGSCPRGTAPAASRRPPARWGRGTTCTVHCVTLARGTPAPGKWHPTTQHWGPRAHMRCGAPSMPWGTILTHLDPSAMGHPWWHKDPSTPQGVCAMGHLLRHGDHLRHGASIQAKGIIRAIRIF